MRKLVNSVLVVSLIGSLALVNGCTLSNNQVKQVAYQAGLFTTLSWFAIDNPPLEAKDQVKDVVHVIINNATNVAAGKTYTEVLIPTIEIYIVNKVPPHIRPLSYAASLALLGGIDIMFAGNPEWKNNVAMSIDIVNSFGQGSLHALSLSERSPEVVESVKLCNRRNMFISNMQQAMKEQQMRQIAVPPVGVPAVTNAPRGEIIKKK